MRKSRFTESQILAILSEGETGLAVAEVCHKHGTSSAKYHQSKSKHAGMPANELKRVKELEAENARLKRMYADLALESAAIKDRAAAKIVTPIARRAAVQIMVDEHHLSRVRACQAVGLPRSALYKPTTDRSAKDAPVIDANNVMLEKRPRWGFWKCFDRLRQEGHPEVLAWAARRFPEGPGDLDEGASWCHDLQVAPDGAWVTVSLSLSGTPAFGEAFQRAFASAIGQGEG